MPDYRTLLIDPPWPERGGGKIKRGADRHYKVLTSKWAILETIIHSPSWKPADDAHLYLWVTNNYLPWGLWLIEALGFTYKTNIAWVKSGKPGLGQYFRGRHELLLFATRGRGAAIRTDRKDIPSVVEAPRGRHSAKPLSVRTMIEARSMGPRVEMFARDWAPGWDAWGHQLSHAEPTQSGGGTNAEPTQMPSSAANTICAEQLQNSCRTTAEQPPATAEPEPSSDSADRRPTAEQPHGKVLVTGTGRCGTSCLMQLLTILGESTGFRNSTHGFFDENMAGQEIIVTPTATSDQREAYDGMRVLKDPRLCWSLRGVLDRGLFEVAHVFVPIRDVGASAESRLAKGLPALAMGESPDECDDLEERQARFMYESLGHLLETLALFEIPYTTIKFPKFVEDPKYLYDRLRRGPVLAGVSFDDFLDAHGRVLSEDRLTIQGSAAIPYVQAMRDGVSFEVAHPINLGTMGWQPGNSFQRWRKG